MNPKDSNVYRNKFISNSATPNGQCHLVKEVLCISIRIRGHAERSRSACDGLPTWFPLHQLTQSYSLCPAHHDPLARVIHRESSYEFYLNLMTLPSWVVNRKINS